MIETMLFWILSVLTLGFAVIHLFAWRGLKNLARDKSDVVHSFSIIVAARNEEKHISRLVESCNQLEYPKDKFEIIVVDDRSSDATKEILERLAQRVPNLTIISIEKNDTDMPHKKNALRAGIARARFEILACTDADCTVPKQWLTKLSEQFTDEVGVVAGYSPFVTGGPRRTFNSFLRYEEMKGSLLAAAAIGIGKAFMCTGRNFAYRKNVYDEVGGFEKIRRSVSGDDDLFIQLVQRESSCEIRYMTEPESYVFTAAPDTLNAFINQRIRHISASKYYSLLSKAVLGVLHVQLLAAVAALFVIPLSGIIFLLVRLNFDAILVSRGKELFREECTVREFFGNEFLMLIYLFFIGPMGFLKKFEWKGTNTQ